MCEKFQKFSIVHIPSIGDVSSIENVKKFYNTSALTLEGLDLDSIDDYAKYLDEACGLKEDAKFYIITGKYMNSCLYGDTKYPNDLHIVVVMLDDLKNSEKIILKRFEFGGRWFDDVVDNNGWTASDRALHDRLLRRMKRVIGETASPHGLRHYVACELLSKGVPLETISRVLDHSNIGITHAIYARQDQTTIDDALSLLGGRK